MNICFINQCYMAWSFLFMDLSSLATGHGCGVECLSIFKVSFFFYCWTISREFGSDNKAHIILLSFTPKAIFVELVPLVTLNDSNFLSFGLTGVRCTSDVTLSLGVGVRCNPLDHSDGSRLALIGRFQRLFNSSKQYTHPLSSLLLFLSGEWNNKSSLA